MDQPLVSIIIPVYNSARYLLETIQSALDQTWTNKEIILVDDGSADDSLAIAKEYEGPSVKVFSQRNAGASAARNKGLQEAKGDYIQFLDGDDLLMADKIAVQMAQLKGKKDILSICPVIHFTRHQDISLLKPEHDYEGNDDPFDFLLKLYDVRHPAGLVPIHSWLTPAAVIKKAGSWNETLTVNDDGEFFCRVALASAGIVSANNTLCYYRKYTGENVMSLSGRLNLTALESRYRSLMLKREYLLNLRKDERVDRVIADNLAEVLTLAYPKYKVLSNKIIETINELGGQNYFPVLGGKQIEAIKKIFGWRIARQLQYYFHKTQSN